jgi:hypothetical protein
MNQIIYTGEDDFHCLDMSAGSWFTVEPSFLDFPVPSAVCRGLVPSQPHTEYPLSRKPPPVVYTSSHRVFSCITRYPVQYRSECASRFVGFSNLHATIRTSDWKKILFSPSKLLHTRGGRGADNLNRNLWADCLHQRWPTGGPPILRFILRNRNFTTVMT